MVINHVGCSRLTYFAPEKKYFSCNASDDSNARLETWSEEVSFKKPDQVSRRNCISCINDDIISG